MMMKPRLPKILLLYQSFFKFYSIFSGISSHEVISIKVVTLVIVSICIPFTYIYIQIRKIKA